MLYVETELDYDADFFLHVSRLPLKQQIDSVISSSSQPGS